MRKQTMAGAVVVVLACALFVGTGIKPVVPPAGAATVPGVSVGDASVAEGTSTARPMMFAVTLSAPSAVAVSVQYRIVGVTATAGVDFKATAALHTLKFGLLRSGATAVVKYVSVPVLPNAVVAPDKTFSVILSNPSSGVTIVRAVGTGTILNDDPTPNGFRAAVSDESIAEGDQASRIVKFTVSLTQAAPARVSLDYTVQALSATAGSDFTAPIRVRHLVFSPGANGLTPISKVVPVAVLADTSSEGNETFALVLSNPSVGVAIARGTGIGTILDDDGPRRPLMGTAVRWPTLSTDTAYGAIAGRRFDVVTPENEMKWEATEPSRGVFAFGAADAIVSFAQQHGETVHGHALAWYSQNPAWLTGGTFSRQDLIDILNAHIAAIVGHFRGKVSMWDVVNEAIGDDAQLRPTIWSQGIGPDYVDIAFRAARAADPSALLFINDYNIEGPGPKADALYALVSGLVGRGVPIDGVGFQAHVTAGGISTAGLDSQFARYAALGLQVAVTELDVRLPLPADSTALAAQAATYTAAIDACVSAPNCQSFTTWGFTDEYSWIPSFLPGWGAALPWDANLQTKPAYNALAPYLRN
jgi:GH35 family endo-1,4-beta-xylanase